MLVREITLTQPAPGVRGLGNYDPLPLYLRLIIPESFFGVDPRTASARPADSSRSPRAAAAAALAAGYAHDGRKPLFCRACRARARHGSRLCGTACAVASRGERFGHGARVCDSVRALRANRDDSASLGAGLSAGSVVRIPHRDPRRARSLRGGSAVRRPKAERGGFVAAGRHTPIAKTYRQRAKTLLCHPG